MSMAVTVVSVFRACLLSLICSSFGIKNDNFFVGINSKKVCILIILVFMPTAFTGDYLHLSLTSEEEIFMKDGDLEFYPDESSFFGGCRLRNISGVYLLTPL